MPVMRAMVPPETPGMMSAEPMRMPFRKRMKGVSVGEGAGAPESAFSCSRGRPWLTGSDGAGTGDGAASGSMAINALSLEFKARRFSRLEEGVGSFYLKVVEVV